MDNNKQKGTQTGTILNCLNINQNNGMTRIYGAIEKDPKKTNELFDKLINQLNA